MSVISKALEKANTNLNKTTTWNGDVAYTTTNDPRLDLFFSGLVRMCDDDKLNNMVQLSWSKYPEDTVKLIIHSRDCRTGKGEKKVSYSAMLWLRKYKPLTYLMNLSKFLEYGCFKDLLQLAGLAQTYNLNPLGSDEHYIELELLAEYIKDDFEKYNKYGEKTRISLASKWAPSEGKHFDIKYGFADDMVNILYPNEPLTTSKKLYRKMLSTLRAHLNIIERLTTEGKWNEIDYEKVPAKAHRLLRKAFLKHAPVEYGEYINNLKMGNVKINITGTQPHELVKTYLFNSSVTDETIEGQWKSLVDKVKEKGSLSNTIAISDVSGSMTCNNSLPLSVSIALGILIAQCSSGIFNNKIISFSEKPQVHSLKGDTLKDLINYTRNMDWGMNTNLDSVFSLLLNMSKLSNLDSNNMIKNIVIISDMQFDSAVFDKKLTCFQRARKAFTDAGYELPRVVFWNVNGEISAIPVQSHNSGSILISGFSAELLKDLIENGFNTDPIGFLLSVIGKYEVEVSKIEI
jgi:hypothetical protein